MAAPVVRPQPLTRAPGPAPVTADLAFWRTFKSQIQISSSHNAAITSITVPDVNPTGVQAENFVVTTGGRIQIYSTRSRKLVKSISRFGVDDTARSGVLRRDGRILLAGGDSGVVQAFDVGSRAILRQWRGEHAHKQPVHCVRWDPSTLTDVLSVSDDRTVRVWDLTHDQPKWVGLGHEDYVRCACYLPDQGGGIVTTGSYDHTVRVWDTRQPNVNRSAMTFKHKASVEGIMALNSSTLVAAAGNEVTILDLVAGKPEHIIRSHQKAVMALSTAQNGLRIVTGGLDGHVKVHARSSWEVVAGFKYPAPVLSLNVIGIGAVQKEDRHLAVGLQNGFLSLRTRLAGSEKVRTKEREAKMQALLAGDADAYERKKQKKDMRQGVRARDRGKDFRGEGVDIVIDGNEKRREKRLRPWQSELRRGHYSRALDMVLSPEKRFNNDDMLTLLTALRHRSALRASLSNRNEESLQPILRWTFRYIINPRHLTLTYDVLLQILDLYSDKIGTWQNEHEGREVLKLLVRIGKRVRKETDLAQQCEGLRGMIELLGAG